MSLTRRVKKYSPEQLETLAANKQNTVYEYQERTPLPKQQVVPVALVYDKIKRLRAAYLRLRHHRQHGMSMEYTYQHNSEIKRQLCKTLEWKRFDFTHPCIFDTVTGFNTTTDDMTLLIGMIRMRSRKPHSTPQHVVDYIRNQRQKS